MVTITDYTVEYNSQKDVYRIVSREILFCPLCGGKLSGYDTRRRHIVDYAGNTYWLLLQRYRCSRCKKLHVAAPSFIIPQKHYEAKSPLRPMKPPAAQTLCWNFLSQAPGTMGPPTPTRSTYRPTLHSQTVTPAFKLPPLK